LLTQPKFVSTLAISLFVAVFTASLAAQTVKVEGQIKGRSGNEIILQTSDNPDLIVILHDDTQVSQAQGVLKARRKEMSMAALIPGLPVKIEGTYNATNGLSRNPSHSRAPIWNRHKRFRPACMKPKHKLRKTKQK